MRIDALFFDFDGVIADTETIWLDCIYGFCVDRNVPVSRRELLDCLGDGDVRMMRLVSDRSGMAEKEIAAALHESFVEKTRDLGMRPGISRYLEFARKQGLKRALVSNSNDAYISNWLKRLGIEAEFDFVITRDSGLPIKPAPDMYSRAAQALQVQPERAIAIEDSVIGLTSALGAGLYAAAYPNACSEEDVRGFCAPVVDLGRMPPEQMIDRVFSYYRNGIPSIL